MSKGPSTTTAPTDPPSAAIQTATADDGPALATFPRWNLAIADVVGVVGLVLLLVAWDGFGSRLLFSGEGEEEVDHAVRAFIEGVPAILLTLVGFGLLGRAPRADRFGALLLLVGGVRWLEAGASLARSVAVDGTGPGLVAGAILWLAVAAAARHRSGSVYTDLGLAAAIVMTASRVGQIVIAGSLGIDLVTYETPVKDPGVVLPLAVAAWYAAFAVASFILARRLALRPEAGDRPDPWGRALIFDVAAAGLAAIGIQGAITQSYVADRAIVAPASSAILIAVAAIMLTAGLAARAAPYYLGAVYALAAAYTGAASESVSILRNWPAILVAGLVLGALAIGVRHLERRAELATAAPRWRWLGSGPRASSSTVGQLRDLIQVSLADVLAATSAGFLLGSWFSWAFDLTGRWSDLIRHGLPAVVLATLSLLLLRRAGSVGRLAGVLALAAGVEIAVAGSVAFTALTRNEGGVGGLVGAVYWILFAALMRYRHRAVATQVGAIAAITLLGVQGNLALPALVFGAPTEGGDAGPSPGPILPMALAVWWAAIGSALVTLARHERAWAAGGARPELMAAVTELAAAFVLPIGLANALLNYHAGWDRGIQPPVASALVGLVALGLLWLRARTKSSFYLVGAGIALVLAIGDLNEWLGLRYAIPTELLAGAEGALLVGGVTAAALRRRRASGSAVPARDVDPGP